MSGFFHLIFSLWGSSMLLSVTVICCFSLLCVLSHSVISNSFAIPWTVARQSPLSMGFPRQEYWSGLPFTSPGDLSNLGIKPVLPATPALQVDSFLLSHHAWYLIVWIYPNFSVPFLGMEISDSFYQNTRIFLEALFKIAPNWKLSNVPKQWNREIRIYSYN